MELHKIRQELKLKTIYDIPLRVTFYARVSTEKEEQLNSLDNQISYYTEFIQKNPNAKIYMATTKSKKTYCDVNYEEDCFIMFGKESAGIPEEILVNYKETSIRIPMIGDIRSLNLSNSVAIVAYEALRQNEFKNMNLKGDLHRLSWND